MQLTFEDVEAMRVGFGPGPPVLAQVRAVLVQELVVARLPRLVRLEALRPIK